MTRQFDRKEVERDKYIQDTSTNQLKEENRILTNQNEKLKEKVAKLKARLKNVELLLEQLKSQ